MTRLLKTWFYPRNLALLVMAGSIAALAFAYISQYGFNLQPCVLCLQQRKPYFAAILLAGIAFFSDSKMVRILLMLSAVSLLAGSGIAAYHTGVEQNWWAGTAACGGGNLPENATIEELQKYLSRQPVVRCDVPAWKLFGISMTGYNLMYSTVFAVFILAGIRKARKLPQ